jgi:hypothetical protein
MARPQPQTSIPSTSYAAPSRSRVALARPSLRTRWERRRNAVVVFSSSSTNDDDDGSARRRAEDEEVEILMRRRDAARIVSRVVPGENSAAASRIPPKLTSERLDAESAREQQSLANEVALMFASGAILGPLLDHQHSRFDVLHYTTPWRIRFDLLLGPLYESPLGRALDFLAPEPLRDLFGIMFVNETGVLETGWWVPPLFGAAAVVIGVGHTSLDAWRIRASVRAAREQELRNSSKAQTVRRTADLIDECPAKPALGFTPGWTGVNLCISVFAFQYLASGILASPESPFVDGFLPYHLIDLILAVWACLTWYVFDNTRQGLFMAGLTAFAGPCAEIVLINYGHLYEYSHSDFAGIPSWIPYVYACGAPAVGNLSRQVRNELRAMSNLPGPTTRVASYDKTSVQKQRALDDAAYKQLDRGKRVVNKNLKEPQKGRFTILADGPIDVKVLAKKRQEEAVLAKAIASSRGGTQKRKKPVRRFAARQRDKKLGRKSVRDRIVGLLVRRKDPSLSPKAGDEEQRVAAIRAELEAVEKTLDELERLKTLKQQLKKMQQSVDAAAPPMLPKLRRMKTKIESSLPAPFRPAYESLNDAIEEAGVFKAVLENSPQRVRRAVEGSFASEEERLLHIREMNSQLDALQLDLASVIATPERAKGADVQADTARPRDER